MATGHCSAQTKVSLSLPLSLNRKYFCGSSHLTVFLHHICIKCLLWTWSCNFEVKIYCSCRLGRWWRCRVFLWRSHFTVTSCSSARRGWLAYLVFTGKYDESQWYSTTKISVSLYSFLKFILHISWVGLSYLLDLWRTLIEISSGRALQLPSPWRGPGAGRCQSCPGSAGTPWETSRSNWRRCHRSR